MTSLSQRLNAVQGALAQKRREPVQAQFGEWLPDLAALGNPGSTEALNVIATADGYGPIKDLSVFSSALTARVQGVLAGTDTSGNVIVYAGDATKLYRLVGTSFEDISKSGGYSTSDDDAVEFTQYGATMIATNYTDPVQGVAVGSSPFADLITSTNKPKARHIDIIRDFVVLGNTQDVVDGIKPGRVWWSGINDPTDFTPNATTQSDFQDIPTGGWVQRIIGGAEYGLVFLEREIHRMTYVGSPLVFSFDPVDRKRGTPIPGSVIGFGRVVFYISDEGFMVTDGVNSVPIGQNKVDQEFWNQIDATYFSRVSAAVDPVNKVVIWSFPGSGSSAGVPNVSFLYNWVDKKWSQADLSLQMVARAFRPGYTLDTLDTVTTDLDALPFSLDSRAWTGGRLELVAFGTDNKMYLFEGSNRQATIETQEVTSGGHAMVRSVRPIVDVSSATAAIASRVRQADAATYGASASMDTSGKCNLRSQGRYHRAKIVVPSGATWTKAQGAEIEYAPTGQR